MMARVITLIGIFAAAGLGLAPLARAGVWVQASGMAWSASDQMPGGLEVDSSHFVSSSTLGYAFPQGFFVGAQVLTNHETSSSDFEWAWGPKGGLLLHGFELTAAFLPQATDTTPSVSRKGSGFAVNLGYSRRLFSVFRGGIYGTYWASTYDQVGGVSVEPKEHVSHLTPMLSVGAEF